MTVLICTTEKSGVDRYSQEIAKLLPVDILYTPRYKLGLRAYSLLKNIAPFQQVIHLTNQHLGRYALLLSCPYIVTVHDLARMCFPFPKEKPLERIGLKLDALALKKAKHIIAVSQNTKNDLLKNLGVPEDKITVIHNGVNHAIFRPRASWAFPFPYILYVGSERPRKNLGRLLSAFAALKKSGEFGSLKLIKVGEAGRSIQFRQDTHRKIKELGLEQEVIFTEQVTDEELAAYYSQASALVYPSLYEGFGLPVIEAMACQCPVITSNVSSLPEVAGNAALLVDPYDVAGLSQAMSLLLTDPELREKLTAKGYQRSQRFSWEKTAVATLAVYHTAQAPIFKPAQGWTGLPFPKPETQDQEKEKVKDCQPVF